MDLKFNTLDRKVRKLATKNSKIRLDVIHRAGIKHQATDALSPPKTTGEDETPIKDEIPVLSVTPSNPPKMKR